MESDTTETRIIDGLNRLGEDHLGALAVLAFVVPTLLAILLFVIPYFMRKSDSRRLDDRANWVAIADELHADTAKLRYRSRLVRVSAWADGIFGPKLLGWRAFDRNLLIALFYPILAALFGWVLFNQSNIGGSVIGGQGKHSAYRLFVLALVVANLVFVVWIKKIDTKSRPPFCTF